jgi:hypothetical protein
MSGRHLDGHDADPVDLVAERPGPQGESGDGGKLVCAADLPGTALHRVFAFGGVQEDVHRGAVDHFDPAGHAGVDQLLALVVAAAEAGAALAADGVDLVDEHNRGRPLAGGGEHLAHPGRAVAHEHLEELGPGDGHERHLGLTGHGAGEPSCWCRGPTSRMPLEILAPSAAKAEGSRRYSATSQISSLTAS